MLKITFPFTNFPTRSFVPKIPSSLPVLLEENDSLNNCFWILTGLKPDTLL
jgi:hypothetical protein